ncbi:hypothetical protein CWO84_04795 [Methylomonas sp. Kb3]|uniref:hypothetical protein n=1 Tax=Methylomonas sp. Kb3 TaxID=1611544 RepID=UPI000C32ACFE|nr:hypothetical protein [Methylomonas sp. Kb3]PKD41453.1 hypothetical protein CWO84_04795 [Methylomonas sp. Kb3]
MSQQTDSARIEQQMALVNSLTQAFGDVINGHGEAVKQAQQGELSADALHYLIGANVRMVEASQWALQVLLADSKASWKDARFVSLSSSDRSTLDSYMKSIESASSAIASCSSLLFKFLVDDDCGDEIPDEVKSNYIRSGTLESIMVAVNKVVDITEALGDQIQGGAA